MPIPDPDAPRADETTANRFAAIHRAYLPFAVRYVEEMTSVLLCPLAEVPYQEAASRPVDLDERALRRLVLGAPRPDVFSASDIAETLRCMAERAGDSSSARCATLWALKPDVSGSETFVFIARLLSVVRLFVRLSDGSASAQRTVRAIPAEQRGHCAYISSEAPALLIPNGNIDRLLVLMWRFVVCVARDARKLRARAKTLCAEALSNEMLRLFDPVGACPGYDLLRWRTEEPDVRWWEARGTATRRRIPYAWSGGRPKDGVRDCLRVADSIERSHGKLASVPRNRPDAVSSSPRSTEWTRIGRYHRRCHRALRLVSLALRILGHIAWLAEGYWHELEACRASVTHRDDPASATYTQRVHAALKPLEAFADRDPPICWMSSWCGPTSMPTFP